MDFMEGDASHASLERSLPFGEHASMARTVRQLGLEHTIRRERRPTQRKEDNVGKPK